MADITNIDFWKASLTRVVHTAAQTAIATIGTTAALSGVDWLMVADVTALACVLSLLKSIVVDVPEVD